MLSHPPYSPDMSPPAFDLLLKFKKPLRGKRFRSIEEVSNEVTRVIRRINNEGVLTGIQDLPKRWTAVIKHSGDYIEGLLSVFCEINSFLKRKRTVCRIFEITHVSSLPSFSLKCPTKFFIFTLLGAIHPYSFLYSFLCITQLPYLWLL